MGATENHVVRIGPVADHAREARLALAAREIGVRTPRPAAWSETYGIWERSAGSVPTADRPGGPDAWAELLDDLETLHAHPLEAFEPRRDSRRWRGRPWLLGATQEAAAVRRLLAAGSVA